MGELRKNTTSTGTITKNPVTLASLTLLVQIIWKKSKIRPRLERSKKDRNIEKDQKIEKISKDRKSPNRKGK